MAKINNKINADIDPDIKAKIATNTKDSGFITAIKDKFMSVPIRDADIEVLSFCLPLLKLIRVSEIAVKRTKKSKILIAGWNRSGKISSKIVS